MNQTTVPAYDLPCGSLSPIVLDAMSRGATTMPHPTDPNAILVVFKDEAEGEAFGAAIDAILNPKPAPKPTKKA